MSNLRVAVVGAGHLGRIHARLLADQPAAELVAVVDPSEAARKTVSTQLNCTVAESVDAIKSDFDAAIVAAPSSLHHRIGCDLLSRGKHVLMEKPLAPTREESDALVQLANDKNRILQVGHVERFNPVTNAALAEIDQPKYIDSRRTSGFTFRSTDIGVVLDLMIHDIDLILHMVQSRVTKVQALGASVFGGHEDMAQARLEFANGCVANLLASRSAMTAERRMNVFCRNMYAGIDFANREANIVRPRHDLADQTFRAEDLTERERAFVKDHLFDSLLVHRTLPVGEANPLADEQADFIAAVQNGSTPQVTGQAGRDAVAIAEEICNVMAEHSWNGEAPGPVGPHFIDQPTILKVPQPAVYEPWQRKAG
ncbi:MAG: Gfo/Idh/MocA family oxidoreductase [Planctomycetota bacterium]